MNIRICRMSCKHIFATGPKKGQRCPVIPADGGDYCAKHRKSTEKKQSRAHTANNLGNDALFAGTGGRPKTAAKNRYSVWLITLNSNKDIDKMTYQDKKQFKDAMDYVFNRENIFDFFTESTGKGQDAVVKLNMEHHFEVGPSGGRLHVHALVDITHTGNFRFEANRLRAFLKQALGYNIYLNAPVSGNQSAAYAQYAAKREGMSEVRL